MLSSVYFSLNRKSAFFYFSCCKLPLRFFGKSIQPRLYVRLSEQNIPFSFFRFFFVNSSPRHKGMMRPYGSLSHYAFCFYHCNRFIQ